MGETTIGSLLHMDGHFTRSVHLERDFADPTALDGYVLTDHIRDSFARIVRGLGTQFGQRAWRITGDYGSGKSSLALALSHLFAAAGGDIPRALRSAVDFESLGVERPQLLPILVTGSRETLSTAILRSLRAALLTTCADGQMPTVIGLIESHLLAAVHAPIADTAILDVVSKATAYLTRSGKASGLLLVLDELGKFLEYAALYPDRQDVYLLQMLAEAAAHSGSQPLVVVGLLHQNFNAYAEQISRSREKEWEKVAGRFEEILFRQPLEQTAALVADALRVDIGRVPADLAAQTAVAMEEAIGLRWYGAAANADALRHRSAELYPLHPTVLPVLVRLFQRFGQNERSLFSFLASYEPFGFQDYASRPLGPDPWYRLHHLYDYARATFGERLNAQGYRSHWTHIESVVESFPADDELDLQILKTVGMLNLVDASHLLPSRQAVTAAVAAHSMAAKEAVAGAVRMLHERRGVLHFRGVAGGYCLWPYTSVNLERALADASDAIGPLGEVAPHLRTLLDTRPLVARRHYIETGNLRYFAIAYVPIRELDAAIVADSYAADGRIIVPLCETDDDCRAASLRAQCADLVDRSTTFVAIPPALHALRSLMQEVLRWEYVIANTPELVNDTYAATEAERQLETAKRTLRARLDTVVGLHHLYGTTQLSWFLRGESHKVETGRALLELLSTVCDRVYHAAPQLSNELVNRQTLSSAAAAARQRLLEGMFSGSTHPYLGMDAAKTPPEMSMYLSVLEKSRLHRRGADGYLIAEPMAEEDECRVRPALARVRELLMDIPGRRVRVSDLFAALRRPPYGVRDGLLPLLLAAFAIIDEQDVAFYEDGSFMRHISGEDFRRLIKDPSIFEVQYCRVSGVRSDLFAHMLHVLKLPSGRNGETKLLDVVRPLTVFAAQLPTYAHKTQRLTPRTLAVRTALLGAREPATLVFQNLPEACGYPAFDIGAESRDDIADFVVDLRASLDEMKAAFPDLHSRMRSAIMAAFDAPEPFVHGRHTLAVRAKAVAAGITEPRLKSLCFRLLDDALPEEEWLESVGSFVRSKPPAKWIDQDAEAFFPDLERLASHFRRVESMTFVPGAEMTVTALRVAMTRADGAEVEQVLYLDDGDEAGVTRVQEEIARIVGADRRLGALAASRALWAALSREATDE